MLKKFVFGLLLGSLLVGIIWPQVILAQARIPTSCVLRRDPKIKDADDKDLCPYGGATTCVVAKGGELVGTTCHCHFEKWKDVAGVEHDGSELCGMCCLMSTIYYITDWMFTILIVLVVIFVVWGGFDFLTAAGAEEKITGARNRIMYAGVGLAVALLARAVPAIVRYMVAP